MRAAHPTVRRDLRPVLLGILLVGAFTTVGFFHTWLRIEGLRIGYALSKATTKQRALQRENERLKLEVATLEAPARIARIARETLQMRLPRAGEVIVVRAPPAAPTQVASRSSKSASDVAGGPRGDG